MIINIQKTHLLAFFFFLLHINTHKSKKILEQHDDDRGGWKKMREIYISFAFLYITREKKRNHEKGN